MDTIGALFSMAIIFAILVAYFNAKNNYQEKHPKKCSFCGKDHADPFKLRDGYICWDCCVVKCKGRQVNIRDFIDSAKGKMTSVAELKNYMGMIWDIESQPFVATRVSPSGRIAVDDKRGLFLLQNVATAQFPHKIANIRSFKIKMEEDSYSQYNDTGFPIYDGGYIAIKMNELIDTVILETSVNNKMIGMRHEVKKTYEEDLKFLEAISGKHRSL